MGKVSVQEIKELMTATGVGMMDCKKALVETDGDMEKAILVLREKGLATQAKKSGRVAAEGICTAVVEGNAGCVLEVNIETDFAANNQEFKDFVAATAKTVIEQNPADVEALKACKIAGGDTTVEEALQNLFIKIGKTMETFSLDIPGIGVYSTHSLGAGYSLNTWTLEIKAHPYNMKSRGNDQLCRFCCWNEDGGGQVLLRFNENGKPWKTLDIVAPSGRYVTGSTGDPATGSFEQNQWYMISIVWDGSNMSVYINGEKDTPTENSVSGNQAFNLNRFEIGMSWGGYGSSQSYTGRMAEMRIWNIARSASDIASTQCSVDPKSEGLVGYWKMNEGEGHVFHDSVAGNDMDWDKSERQKDENNYVTTPEAGASIVWVKDEKNKCAQ